MRRLALFTAISFVTIVVACEAGDSNSPSADSPIDASTSTPTDGASNSTPDAAASDPDASDGSSPDRSSTLGVAGGTIDADEGRIRLAVPPDALTKDTTITVKRLTVGPSDGAISRAYDLGPNGTTFEKDIKVCIRTEEGTATDKACLGYLDESTEPPKWVCEDECLTKGDGPRVVCGSTSHFTNFAILLTGGRGDDDSCTDTYITSKGGSFSSSDGLTTVTFPKGALEKSARIYAKTLPPIDNANVGSKPYELSPSGKFSAPVEVCVTPNAGTKTDASCLGYLDAAGGKWVCEDTCLEEKGTQLCGTTSHFTNFALLLTGGTGTKCPK